MCDVHHRDIITCDRSYRMSLDVVFSYTPGRYQSIEGAAKKKKKLLHFQREIDYVDSKNEKKKNGVRF